jgi:Ca2+-binding EF-hand superfamily protein
LKKTKVVRPCQLTPGYGQVIFYWTLLARQISHYFDSNPKERPVLQRHEETRVSRQIALSEQQEAHILEIFELFDTDGGGTIDRQELSAALYALGFKETKGATLRNTSSSREEHTWAGLGQSGQVHIGLEEFTALMKGEINGRDPLEEIRAVFAALQRPDGPNDPQAGLVTFSKLRRACKEFQLLLTEEELLLMIDSVQVDVNRNGGVSEEEFCQILQRSIWF